MKKTLSLLLVLAMVLSSFTFAFAEEPAKTPGEVLKDLGVLAGNAEGDLMLDKELLRQDMIVLLSRLYGQEDEAKAFEGKTSFTDVKDAYYVPFMAWAEANKLTKGVGEGLFGFGRPVTTKEVANFMLNALGYTDVKWEDVAAKAVELGLVAEDADLEANCIRSLMAEITLKALGLKVNGEEKTLAEKLGLELPKPAVSENLEIKAVKAIGNDKVEVKLVEGVEAVAPEAFAIVEKGTTTALEVKDAVLESAKVVVLTTAPMTAGKAYTLTAKEVSINFTGIAKDTAAPKVTSVKVVDTNTVEIAFDKVLDKESAEVVANYSVNNNVKVVSAALESDRKTVTLTTEGVQKGKLYTLKVEEVKSVDLVVMKAVSRNFVGTIDNLAPKIASIEVKTNTRLIVNYADDHGVDKASAENLENYSIKDLGIVSIEAKDDNEDGYYEKVVVITESQTAGKLYTLTVSNLVDGSVSANAITKALTKDFRGKRLDSSAPTVAKTPEATTNTTVEVLFSDESALDVASATDITNYEFNNDLVVEKAEILDDSDLYDAAGKTVVLTTSSQDAKKTYALTIKGVKDEFGNEMKPISGTRYRTYYVTGKDIDTIPAYVKNVVPASATTVKVYFNEKVDKATATDPTNYSFSGGLGAAIKATLDSTSRSFVTLTTPAQTANKSYTITINGVADLSGNVMSNVKASFVAVKDSVDVTAPQVTYIEALYKDELRVHFDEAVEVVPGNSIVLNAKKGETSVVFTAVGFMDDNTTVVMTSSDMTNVKYIVDSIENVQDTNKNAYVDPEVKHEFWGSTLENDRPEITTWEQLDVNTIRVYFTEPVNRSISPVITNAAGFTGTWTALVDPDDAGDYEGSCTVDFVANKVLPADKDFSFNFSAMVQDLVGTAAADEGDEYNTSGALTKDAKTVITPYIIDEDRPVLVNVEAKDINTIVLTFSESISTPGSYRISYDDNGTTRRINGSATVDGVDNTKVNLKTVDALKAEYIYTLTPVTGAVDLAGNRMDVADVTFDFVGTNVRPNADYIKGVAIVYADVIKVSATSNIASVTSVYEGGVTTPTNLVSTSEAISATTQKVTLKAPLLADNSYTITVNGDLTYTFSGVINDNGIEIAADGEVTYVGNPNDAEIEKVVLYNENYDEITSVTSGQVVYVYVYRTADDQVLYGAKLVVPAE